MSQAQEECGVGGGSDTHFHLRIGSVFVILVGATGGALFPVLVKRSKKISLPGYVFEYVHSFSRLPVLVIDRIQVCKVFWIRCNRMLSRHPPQHCVSIVHQFATAFIHLLAPALEALSSPCLPESWQTYVSHCLTTCCILFTIVLAICSRPGHAQPFLFVSC